MMLLRVTFPLSRTSHEPFSCIKISLDLSIFLFSLACSAGGLRTSRWVASFESSLYILHVLMAIKQFQCLTEWVAKRTDKRIFCQVTAYKGNHECLCLLFGDFPSAISISSLLSLGRETPLGLRYGSTSSVAQVHQKGHS